MAGGEKNLWIVANWKSNKKIKEALDWLSEVGPKIERRDNLKIVVCPPFTVLSEFKKEVLVGNYPILVGSQNLSPFDTGAFTGEIAASFLNELVDLSIIGHSERREKFSETNEMVEQKFLRAQENNIIPLLCVQGADTPIPKGSSLVAYEPIFAIGSGHPDTPQNANEVAGDIKQKVAEDIEVLYGGSVTSENAKAFVEQDNISGLLIGKSSLENEEFLEIIRSCSM